MLNTQQQQDISFLSRQVLEFRWQLLGDIYAILRNTLAARPEHDVVNWNEILLFGTMSVADGNSRLIDSAELKFLVDAYENCFGDFYRIHASCRYYLTELESLLAIHKSCFNEAELTRLKRVDARLAAISTGQSEEEEDDEEDDWDDEEEEDDWEDDEEEEDDWEDLDAEDEDDEDDWDDEEEYDWDDEDDDDDD